MALMSIGLKRVLTSRVKTVVRGICRGVVIIQALVACRKVLQCVQKMVGFKEVSKGFQSVKRNTDFFEN